MKYLILCLLLASCSVTEGKDHKKELEDLKQTAEKICKCHGGILTLQVSEYENSKDNGFVVCKDHYFLSSVQDYVIVNICEKGE